MRIEAGQPPVHVAAPTVILKAGYRAAYPASLWLRIARTNTVSMPTM